jgi:hypothetical protein
MSRLDELIAEATRLRDEANAAVARANEADQAVLVERFKDWPQYREGDIVLVPRKLFGERKMWPARVEQARLKYNTGTYGHGDRAGQPWETMSIAYTVTFKAADGTFTGQREGYHHYDVHPFDEAVAS